MYPWLIFGWITWQNIYFVCCCSVYRIRLHIINTNLEISLYNIIAGIFKTKIFILKSVPLYLYWNFFHFSFGVTRRKQICHHEKYKQKRNSEISFSKIPDNFVFHIIYIFSSFYYVHQNHPDNYQMVFSP